MSKIQLPQLSGKYGAPMGRRNQRLDGKCRLQKVPFVDGAYDQGGAYWGCGTPLYVAQSEDGNQAFVRANSRAEAKELLQNDGFHSDLSFYR